MPRSASSRRRRPNVLVFFTDQQRWDTVGLHGNPLGLTPHFDRLARAGTHLAHSFTCQPVCGPARSCLQTGRYATQTGCHVNGIPLGPRQRTLAHHFGKAGYRTGYIGKWHLASGDPVPEAERGGYQEWLAANVLEHTSDAYDCVVFNEAQERVKLPGYRVDALTDAAIRFVDRHQADPFFLFLSFLEPHHQNHLDDYPPPDGLRMPCTGRWTPPDLAALGGSSAQHLGGYYGMVRRLDEALGRLTDALKSLGLLEETIVLFTSDHGCHFKTRNAEYKRSCHESSIRVPTFLHGPGFMAGGERSELVSLVDLPATLLDAAGLPLPKNLSGQSLLPRLRQPESPWPDDVFVQISESGTGRAIRTARWKYAVGDPAVRGQWNRQAAAPRYEEEFLYDLRCDPYELSNLIGLESHRAVTERLRARLRARLQAVEGAHPEIVPAPTRGSGQRRVSPAEVDA